MGGAVSAGEDNDELIDNLVIGEYIKSHAVEKVFRAVDRGNYFLDQCRENAYRDLAWKHDKIHISAPCIYSEVMESLKLGPGMSFLNLGSGTGYLSTMAGLLLGPYGTNHGIELHQSNVEYAQDILEDFQNNSPALDKYEFCPPSFVAGNCLLLDPSSHQYDRVYCGASCPSEHENFIKNLVRVGGILVMPLNDNLLQVQRTTETTFDVKNVLPVSFASLVIPNASDDLLPVKLPEKHPLLLQEICRSAVRTILRKIIETENPSLVVKRVVKRRRKKGKRNFRRIIIPFVERENNNGDPPARDDEVPSEDEALEMEDVAPNIREIDIVRQPDPEFAEPRDQHLFQDINQNLPANIGEESEIDVDQNQEMEENNSEDGNAPKAGRRRTLTANGDSGIDNVSDDSLPEDFPLNLISFGRTSSQMSQATPLSTEEKLNSDVEIDPTQEVLESIPEDAISHKGGRRRTLTANGDSGIDNISDDSLPEECPSDNDKMNDSRSTSAEEGCSSSTRPRGTNYLKRSVEDFMEETPESLKAQEDFNRRYPNARESSFLFKRVAFSDPDSDELEEIDSDSDNERLPKYDEKNYLSRYTYFMRQKLNQLPVPQSLKVYLNLSRPIS